MHRPSRGLGAGSRWIGSRPSRGAVQLLVLQVGLFLLYCLIGSPAWMERHLGLVPRHALGREPWQLVTSGLVHFAFSAVLFDAITLWIFGTAVEERAGRRRMLTVFAVAQLAGSLAAALVGRAITPDIVISGCAAGAMGLVAAFGALYQDVPLSLFGAANMRGRTVALLMIGLSAAFMMWRFDWVALAGTTGGALAGWAAASDIADRFIHYGSRFRMWRLRRKYRVISGGRDQKRYLN
jgi:membrane associated rhomboid family serine protease